MNMAFYFHSMIADYYLGIWGGGNPKPFKFTEIQRHRFNLADKEGAADRKVPVQPLVFHSKDGKVTRYNLRKVVVCCNLDKVSDGCWCYSSVSYHFIWYVRNASRICMRTFCLIMSGCMRNCRVVPYKPSLLIMRMLVATLTTRIQKGTLLLN